MSDDRDVTGEVGSPVPGEAHGSSPATPQPARPEGRSDVSAEPEFRAEVPVKPVQAPTVGQPQGEAVPPTPVGPPTAQLPPTGEPGAEVPAAFAAGPGAGGAGAPPFGTGGAYPGYPGYPGFGAPPKPKRRPSGILVAAVVAALLAGGVGGGVGAWIVDRDDKPSSAGVSPSSSPVDPASLNRSPTSVAGIAKQAVPSTVTIKTKGKVSGQGTETGTGAGFVYDKQGHILTNNHVVSLAAAGGELSVTFSDGTTKPAKIVGRAEGYDLAVIKVDDMPASVQPLPLGDNDKVAVGDPVIAIGAPFTLSNTVTTGIVSAKDRPVASGDQQKVSYMNAIQTDAAINPGNSGGPLLNAAGEVIGINSAIRSTGGGGQSPFGQQQESGSIGLGFAIPINQARWVADILIQGNKPVYAQMGILPDSRYTGTGAQIVAQSPNGQDPVTANGPAAKAGLKPGDVITRLNNRAIGSYEDLFSEIWSHRPGDKVKVTYQRDGKEATTEVTLGQRVGDN
ncbi:protease [Embleya scabrispora]|uniref:Protease n=1 Tax=Embleya scabrispora TaxID=159449 RepID=A0A1T3NZM4_9ACTN|nr:trypsin-like peptidase domain-containing protein [Embleya scabrispora]OPC82121.1 protease [Embleya scabrispora]